MQREWVEEVLEVWEEEEVGNLTGLVEFGNYYCDPKGGIGDHRLGFMRRKSIMIIISIEVTISFIYQLFFFLGTEY